MTPTTAPYGAWKSPITSSMIVAGTIGVGALQIDGDTIYWVEMRPQEGGRSVLVQRRPDGSTTDLTPAGFNARTRVHEYGGMPYAVDRGVVFFSNFSDQRLYRQDPGQEPRPITPEAALRYADFAVDRRRGLIYCVREDHRGPREARQHPGQAARRLATRTAAR